LAGFPGYRAQRALLEPQAHELCGHKGPGETNPLFGAGKKTAGPKVSFPGVEKAGNFPTRDPDDLQVAVAPVRKALKDFLF
jgi:hypothetical protein